MHRIFEFDETTFMKRGLSGYGNVGVHRLEPEAHPVSFDLGDRYEAVACAVSLLTPLAQAYALGAWMAENRRSPADLQDVMRGALAKWRTQVGLRFQFSALLDDRDEDAPALLVSVSLGDALRNAFQGPLFVQTGSRDAVAAAALKDQTIEYPMRELLPDATAWVAVDLTFARQTKHLKFDL